ncbi:hypothetical protein D3C72_2272400 [compost metagenome]
MACCFLLLRFKALAVASAVRLVQINKPLRTIMLNNRPKKAQINLIHSPPKSPVCNGRIDSVTNSSAERSEISRVAAISPLYGLRVAVWNISGYQPRPPISIWL